jgi:beta-glucosidase
MSGEHEAALAQAADIEAQLTDDERFRLIFNLMPTNFKTNERDERVPAHVPRCAGWTEGVPRLGIPDLLMSDASLGVTNPGNERPGPEGTALPAGMCIGATFNRSLAYQAGEMLGRECRVRGFNVHLGGGINLPRDPRGGRNFEYLSEDPLLSATLAAETVKGTQAQGVMAGLKHLSLNCQEQGKFQLDARIDPAAHRESDLLAFELAVEWSNPAYLMGAYNKVNGAYCCGNSPILNDAIKDSIGFSGFIMSDWMAVYSWDFALNGLDMHSGAQLDAEEWFLGPLREKVADGTVPRARLSDMVRRILYGMFVAGLDRAAVETPAEVDAAAHDAIALEAARQGIVVLKNEGILPLGPGIRQLAIIGGNANLGAMGGGGGSSQCRPEQGYTLEWRLGGEGMLAGLRIQTHVAPGPVDTLKAALPDTRVVYNSGDYPSGAAALAARSDIAIVVANKAETEGVDNPDMTLPWGMDAVIEAVAQANPNTIVLLQTGNPVEMPWEAKVKAIVQAWYAGQAGGRAIADVLTGAVNPSGRLPVSWPRAVEETPRAGLSLTDITPGMATVTDYHEGAEVGYRWFHMRGATPLYPFGHGLSYTSFVFSDLEASGGETVIASLTVTNNGDRAGAAVPQLYLIDAPGERRMRLIGFDRVELAPGESRRVTFVADPRLLARFDGAAGQWRITDGIHRIAAGASAGDLPLSTDVTLTGRLFGR